MSARKSTDDLRREAAARRHGASLDVWAAVHELHVAGERVAVTLDNGRVVAGYIVRIDGEGFGLDGSVRYRWCDVEKVERNG